jgi:hypothetical protein
MRTVRHLVDSIGPILDNRLDLVLLRVLRIGFGLAVSIIVSFRFCQTGHYHIEAPESSRALTLGILGVFALGNRHPEQARYENEQQPLFQ